MPERRAGRSVAAGRVGVKPVSEQPVADRQAAVRTEHQTGAAGATGATESAAVVLDEHQPRRTPAPGVKRTAPLVFPGHAAERAAEWAAASSALGEAAWHQGGEVRRQDSANPAAFPSPDRGVSGGLPGDCEIGSDQGASWSTVIPAGRVTLPSGVSRPDGATANLPSGPPITA